ncbi:amino-acid N-acetyltransferase [Actinophytocola algeriensis]|uniref:Amino-acid N-acetyltransferase n=1 Tax=Actinophytocola algeriensis TaxID=1768010 RepID=A0A7W7QBT7_9PSEU|nr:amino-acid N-acetyltransferase [Actinophytocola algeriensis]MBE1480627.1 amino-acid N-acetyltransferase [Actinophytocola algeriensis]
MSESDGADAVWTEERAQARGTSAEHATREDGVLAEERREQSSTASEQVVVVRRARVGDVRGIKSIIDTYVGKVLLAKELVTLYEDVQEFWVAEVDGELVGCGGLHVLWEDIAEIRSIAVLPDTARLGIGGLLVERLLAVARDLGLQRVFVLTFETKFFARFGFVEIDGTPVSAEVYEQMRRSADEGVAEFLDLPYAKPNTLGNSRMLLEL